MTPLSKRTILATAIATAIAVPAEGIKLTPYYDPPGILTVCRGHTGADVVKNRQYSMAECDRFMTDDMRHAVATVERCAPGLPVNVLAAFADATFNIGPTIACDQRKSTAARLLANGNWKLACHQLPRWNKARVYGVMVELPGLTKRREAERLLCLS